GARQPGAGGKGGRGPGGRAVVPRRAPPEPSGGPAVGAGPLPPRIGRPATGCRAACSAAPRKRGVLAEANRARWWLVGRARAVVTGGGVGRGLERAQVQIEPRVQRGGQAGERAQGEVLAPRQHLAHPPRGDVHAGGQVSTGEVALVQVPVDFVRELRNELRQFFFYLGLGGLLAGRHASSKAHH